MIKLISIVAGCVLVVAGIILFPMPIPLGAILIACGLVLLMSGSTTIALSVKTFRRRHPGANQAIQAVENRLPESWKRALRRSDP